MKPDLMKIVHKGEVIFTAELQEFVNVFVRGLNSVKCEVSDFKIDRKGWKNKIGKQYILKETQAIHIKIIQMNVIIPEGSKILIF